MDRDWRLHIDGTLLLEHLCGVRGLVVERDVGADGAHELDLGAAAGRGDHSEAAEVRSAGAVARPEH